MKIWHLLLLGLKTEEKEFVNCEEAVFVFCCKKTEEERSKNVIFLEKCEKSFLSFHCCRVMVFSKALQFACCSQLIRWITQKHLLSTWSLLILRLRVAAPFLWPKRKPKCHVILLADAMATAPLEETATGLTMAVVKATAPNAEVILRGIDCFKIIIFKLLLNTTPDSSFRSFIIHHPSFYKYKLASPQVYNFFYCQF